MLWFLPTFLVLVVLVPVAVAVRAAGRTAALRPLRVEARPSARHLRDS